jgi:hypothetical protein
MCFGVLHQPANQARPGGSPMALQVGKCMGHLAGGMGWGIETDISFKF